MAGLLRGGGGVGGGGGGGGKAGPLRKTIFFVNFLNWRKNKFDCHKAWGMGGTLMARPLRK